MSWSFVIIKPLGEQSLAGKTRREASGSRVSQPFVVDIKKEKKKKPNFSRLDLIPGTRVNIQISTVHFPSASPFFSFSAVVSYTPTKVTSTGPLPSSRPKLHPYAVTPFDLMNFKIIPAAYEIRASIFAKERSRRATTNIVYMCLCVSVCVCVCARRGVQMRLPRKSNTRWGDARGKFANCHSVE